jgi:hypothetical protein
LSLAPRCTDDVSFSAVLAVVVAVGTTADTEEETGDEDDDEDTGCDTDDDDICTHETDENKIELKIEFFS